MDGIEEEEKSDAAAILIKAKPTPIVRTLDDLILCQSSSGAWTDPQIVSLFLANPALILSDPTKTQV